MLRPYPSVGSRQDPRRAALVENGHRVLEVGGQRPILGDHGPLVVQGADVRATDVHHGLDGERHAGHESGATFRLTVVRHLRVLVERRSDTVSDQLPHHGVARSLRHLLHRVTDVAHGIGSAFHEDPQVPNYGKPKRGPRLMPDMTLAIEPMVNAGGADIRTLADKWTVVTEDGSLSAHFAHTVTILDKGGPPLAPTTG